MPGDVGGKAREGPPMPIFNTCKITNDTAVYLLIYRYLLGSNRHCVFSLFLRYVRFPVKELTVSAD